MRDEIRRAFDEATEAPHPALRSALRARLEVGSAGGRPRFWQMTVAATVVAGLLAVAFVAGINLLPRGGHPGAGPAAAVSPSPSASTVPSASPSPTATPVVAATDVPQTCLTSSGGGSSMSNVTDVRVGTAAGYDRFVIQFDGPVPSYSITSQSSSSFMQDPTGQMLQLQGSSGIKIVVRGASGTDLNGRQTFTGSKDLKPGYAMLKEARATSDFERVFGWGLGVSNPGCVKVTILTGPDRLVVDVLKP